ncbi:MAG: ProQ/FinO family protein [Alphaproteobacteria bacterium]|nr:ProQ/FinO family protein [Alphaproteobacteria bacterium]
MAPGTVTIEAAAAARKLKPQRAITAQNGTPASDRPPPREQRRIQHERIRAQLAKRFPTCFAANCGQKRPLKIGIYRDIRTLMPEIPGKRLSAVLSFYVGGWDYLRLLVAGAQRFDLFGEPAGEVSAEQAEHAAAQLAASRPRGRRTGGRNERR